jgi:hypothetical protein
VHRFAQASADVDLQDLRERLRKMSERALKRFGEAAKYMCSKTANGNQPPRKPFVVQLEEARAEWKRRHCQKLDESVYPHLFDAGG